MRRTDAVIVCLIAVVTCLLLVVPGAAAVASAAGGGAAARERATPVSGGGGFADAPPLDAGVYGDTLLPRETLFYAVALRSGERLRASATVDVSVGSRSVQDIPDAAAAFPQIRVFTPLRQQVPSEDLSISEAGGDLEALAVDVVGPRVLTAAGAERRAARNEYWTGPGVYHVAITISQITRALGATVEFPLRLAIDVDGRSPAVAPPARASPGPLGDPRAGPRAAALARTRDESSDEPVGGGLLAAGGVGALVVGVAAGWSMAAGRRRRPP